MTICTFNNHILNDSHRRAPVTENEFSKKYPEWKKAKIKRPTLPTHHG